MSQLNSALKNTLVSINGVLKNPMEASISVFDRSFLFGDSIYEATLVKNNVPLFWREHLVRMMNSAKLINLEINVSFKQLEHWVEQLLKEFHSPLGLLRMVVTRGLSPINISPLENYHNNVVIYLLPLQYPDTWYTQGLKYFISTFERNSVRALNPRAKTGNYLNSQLALVEAKQQGFHDALLINSDGYITEGTTNNFWFIKNKQLFTADPLQGVLEGITRHKIIELCQKHAFEIKEGAWTIEQVLQADEAFMSSATKGIVPVVQLSQWTIGSGLPGEMTQKLRTLYEDMVTQYVEAAAWKGF